MTNEWFVQPGYESVRDAFVAGMGSFGRGGGGHCAYVGGQKVVELWGGSARPGSSWQSDTPAVLMSATKGFASICIQVLVDRGAIDVAFAELPSNLITKQLAKTPQLRTIGQIGNVSMLGLGQRFGPNPNAYGAEGLGGQFGFCDPEANIAVGYVRSELAFLDVLQPTLTNELY